YHPQSWPSPWPRPRRPRGPSEPEPNGAFGAPRRTAYQRWVGAAANIRTQRATLRPDAQSVASQPTTGPARSGSGWHAQPVRRSQSSEEAWDDSEPRRGQDAIRIEVVVE